MGQQASAAQRTKCDFAAAAPISALGRDQETEYLEGMNLEPYLARFSIQNPTLLAETPRATLWRADSRTGPAVLKVFSARGLKVGDTIGTKLLWLWGGDGAVRVVAESEDAILIRRNPYGVAGWSVAR